MASLLNTGQIADVAVGGFNVNVLTVLKIICNMQCILYVNNNWAKSYQCLIDRPSRY